MKTLVVLVGAAGLALSAATAQAQEALAKDNGCLTCHSVSSKKMGPSLKSVAADWKKNNVDVTKGVAAIKAKHPDLKAKDEDLKSLATWISGL